MNPDLLSVIFHKLRKSCFDSTPLSPLLLVIVPSEVSDESVKKLPRCHRHARFPAITWRHPRTEALLLRSGGFGRGVGVGGAEAAASHEQELFMAALVALSPLGRRPGRHDVNLASTRRDRHAAKLQQHNRVSIAGSK